MNVQEAIEGTGDSLGGNVAIALDHQHRVVVRAGAVPERMLRHQNEIRAT